MNGIGASPVDLKCDGWADPERAIIWRKSAAIFKGPLKIGDYRGFC